MEINRLSSTTFVVAPSKKKGEPRYLSFNIIFSSAFPSNYLSFFFFSTKKFHPLPFFPLLFFSIKDIPPAIGTNRSSMNAFFHVVFSRHGHNKTARSTTPSPLRGRERNFLIASIFEYDPIKMLFKACGTFITDFIDHHLGLLLFLPTELISLPISNTHIHIYIYTACTRF